MTAYSRSNITQRAERAMGSITVKRMLMAGGGAGITLIVLGRMIPFQLALLTAVIVLTLALILSHPHEGIPRLLFFFLSLRALVAIGSIRYPSSTFFQLMQQVFQTNAQKALLRSAEIFQTAHSDLEGEGLSISLRDSLSDTGLEMVDSPFTPQTPAAQEAS